MRQNYSMLDKVFHWIVLSQSFMGEALYDIEKIINLKKAREGRLGKSVFICGLPRAGTTILMLSLFETNIFASLTYEDMPMVMAPNLWSTLNFSSSKKIEYQERAHGDRILVSFKSPEALDEVFWRTIDQSEYITDKGLVSYEPAQSSMAEFQNYMKLICMKYGKSRYLSKNNNNIFRLHALSTFYKDDVFLVPFRQPLTHAQSLLNLHRRFSEVSSFEISYMKWLGHHEFGATHKHFLFESSHVYTSPENTLEYWIDVWNNCYFNILNVLESGAGNIVPICYEDLCRNKQLYFSAIGEICSVPDFSPSFSASATEPETDVQKEKQELAETLYAQLCDAGKRFFSET